MTIPPVLRVALAHSTPTFRRGLALALLASSLLTTFNAQAVNVRFDPIKNVGVKIWADNKRLLVDDAGAGFYIIGSNDDTDDGNNVASFVRNNNGSLRPMNGATTPHIPYSFTFRRDPQNTNRLFFDASVGPSPFEFTTISFPLDGRRERFTHWRYAGASSMQRYDKNTYRYTPPGGGPIYIEFAPGTPAWGEMIGPDYTVRITVTSRSRPMSLAFVEAPSLSTGVRNVEFGLGRIRKGQSASVSGYIQVFKTDPALFSQAPLTFQSESSPYHQIGRRDGDGWSVRVGDTPGRFMNYGPYTTDVQPGNRTATFRLLLDNTTANNNRILALDVFDSASGRLLAARAVTRRQFANGPFRYHDFTLNFTASAGQRLEFRTYWHGGSYVRQDYVQVR
jgi:hypothetical protein